MSKRLHETIRHLLETTPGLTQRGLAERMGLNPAAVNRMLYGRRNIMADEVPVIESYLGVKLELSGARAARPMEGGGEYPLHPRSARRGGFSDVTPHAIEGGPEVLEDAPPLIPPVPVYAGRRGGEIIDWAPRHPLQMGLRDAYALYVRDDDMQPRYYRGETVYVHPSRPVMTGGDCVIECKDGRLLLRRLVRKSAETLTVLQLSPNSLVEMPLDEIDACYAIIGRG